MLYDRAPLHELCETADMLRRETVDDETVVTWQIDRNVNITNVCISGCRFCNFHCKPHQTERAFITTLAQYREKIDRALELGADQLLLQGGLHPRLGIDFYEQLLRRLKEMYPTLRLHALGAPEVAHIARISSLSTRETLRRLVAAGSTRCPEQVPRSSRTMCAGASRSAKPSAEEWIRVMHEAHEMNLPTSATMMYGHVETPHQRGGSPSCHTRLAGALPRGQLRLSGIHTVGVLLDGHRARSPGVYIRTSPLRSICVLSP